MKNIKQYVIFFYLMLALLVPLRVNAATGTVTIKNVKVENNNLIVTANVSAHGNQDGYYLSGYITPANQDSLWYGYGVAQSLSYNFYDCNNEEVELIFDSKSFYGKNGYSTCPDSNYEISCSIDKRTVTQNYVISDNTIASTSIKKYLSFSNGITVSEYNPNKLGDENERFEDSQVNIINVTQDNDNIYIKVNAYGKEQKNYYLKAYVIKNGSIDGVLRGGTQSILFCGKKTSPLIITMNKSQLVKYYKGMENGKYTVHCYLFDEAGNSQLYSNHNNHISDTEEADLTFPEYIDDTIDNSNNNITQLNTSKKTIAVGKKASIKLLNSPSSKIKWKLSNKKAKIVKKKKNKVTILGVKKGNAVLTAKVNGKTYKCKIKITEKNKKSGTNYVLNTSTMKFHYPSCRDVKKIKAENYETSGESRSELIKQGYSPCGHCRP